MKTQGKRHATRWRLLAACYLVALAVWLCVCGVHLLVATLHLRSGTLARQELVYDDFQTVEGFVFGEAPGLFISTDSDPKLVFSREGGFYAENFVFRARPLNNGCGETVLYYTTKPGEGFTDAKKLWPQQAADGAWVFDLGGRKVQALRLDPDSVGGVYWQVDAMVLNEPVPPVRYFVPNTLQMVLLLAMPLLAWAAISEIMVYLHPLFARRRFEKRWSRLGTATGGEKPKPKT